MLSNILYIGPGMGLGTIIIVLIILALIIFSFGYILWIPVKNFFRKLLGKSE